MRVRHRIPTIFSLYMVDVFCCALGCVILLWLLNLRNAEDQTQETTLLLHQAEEDYHKANARLKETEDLARTQGTDLTGARVLIADLAKRLEEVEAQEAA